MVTINTQQLRELSETIHEESSLLGLSDAMKSLVFLLLQEVFLSKPVMDVCFLVQYVLM